MKVSLKIPDEGLITSVKVDGREVVLDTPVKIKKGDKVIDLTGVRRQAEADVERMGDRRHRDFLESE